MKKTIFTIGNHAAGFAAAGIMAVAGIAAVSCSKTEVPAPDGIPGTVVVRAGIADYSGSGPVVDGENVPVEIQACIFEDGRMTSVYEDIRFSGTGYEISVDRHSGNLYMLANTASQIDLQELQGQGITEAEWLMTTMALQDAAPVHFYTGSVSLEGKENSETVIPLTLKRGVARFDLRLRTAGVASVNAITVGNAAGSAYLFPVAGELSPEDAARESMTKTFDIPLTGDTPAVMYVYEQARDGIEIRIDAVIDGRPVTLSSGLPHDIERNRIYTLTVRKDVIDISLEVSVEDWGEGGDVEISPDRTDRLAVSHSVNGLPPGVEVSEDGKVIRLPYHATDFVFSVESNDALELMPSSAYLLDIVPVKDVAGDGFRTLNSYRVTKGLYAPGVEAAGVTLRFRRKGLGNVYPEDSIRLELPANPTSFKGRMDFDNPDYSHDFAGYTDNEFGVFTLPEGKRIDVEFAGGEDAWIKLDGSSGNPSRWRVLGGWRPNDPTANGRRQSATIVISDVSGGGIREEYTVSRLNYGLPVTWLHGVWWCRYNSMGDSRDFNDQILSSDDPAAAAGMTVFDYLESLSSEEYRRLWQWAYIGRSGKGMKVIESDGIPVMEGYAPDQTNINRLPADALSPDGYELPSMGDFNRLFDAESTVWMMWDGTHRLKEPWNGHSIIKRQQRRKNGISVGSLVLSDLIYIALSSPDYPEHEPLVWYGPGAQWDAGGIGHYGHYNNILFSVHSPEGEGWYLGGSMGGLYVYKNGAGPKDTRVLRFKKSDVEYIY